MIRFFGYRKCGTCRKAEKTLERLGVDYEFIDITEQPPDAATLEEMARQARIEPRKMFNTSGVQYRELKLKERLPDLPDHEILALLAGNGRLIKRPLVTDGRKATIGFDPEAFERTWAG